MSLDSALNYTFENEGGFTNNPHDHGGATRWGITIHDLSRYLGRPATLEEMKTLSQDTAKAIYEKDYYNPLDCPKMVQRNIDVAMFDIGVVRGLGIPGRYAQRVCNQLGRSLEVDGVIGPKTIEALNTIPRIAFLRGFSEMAEHGFREIVAEHPSQAVFLHGWVNRAKRLLTLI